MLYVTTKGSLGKPLLDWRLSHGMDGLPSQPDRQTAQMLVEGRKGRDAKTGRKSIPLPRRSVSHVNTLLKLLIGSLPAKRRANQPSLH